MIYRLTKSYPDDLLVLPGEILEKIEDVSETELKILLLAARQLSRGGVEEEELCGALEENYPRETVLSTLSFWRGRGVLKSDSRRAETRRAVSKAPVSPRSQPQEVPVKKEIDADELPFYSAQDLADATQRQPAFQALVSFAQERLETVLNPSGLGRLYAFVDYLKMPTDVIMLVIEDCVSRDKKSLRYITKMLTSFQDEGIDTYEKAEAWLLARKESVLYEKHVRTLFGLGERKLSRAESEMVETWRKSFEFGKDMLDAAYEKTVGSAKTPSIKYMHKILESWYLAGATTPQEAEKASQKGRNEGEKAEKSFDSQEFFRQAVSKGRKNL